MLLETLAVAVGPAIAKSILKAWLGEAPSHILGALLDHFAEKGKTALQDREVLRHVEQIGARVAEQLRPVYQSEFSALAPAGRVPVARALADTLEKAPLSAELPEFRSAFLVQLAWADLLPPDQLDALLANYEEEVRVQLLMQQEKVRRQEDRPARAPREVYLWDSIMRNVVSLYENELNWVRQVRAGLKPC